MLVSTASNGINVFKPCFTGGDDEEDDDKIDKPIREDELEDYIKNLNLNWFVHDWCYKVSERLLTTKLYTFLDYCYELLFPSNIVIGFWMTSILLHKV